MGKKLVPHYIFCVRCASRVEMVEDRSPEAKRVMEEHGYAAIATGVCECGVVYVLCYQPLPASPTFSLFFDVYDIPEEYRKRMLIRLKSK